MPAQKTTRGMSDTYFMLVKQFPLTHIRNKAHLHAAMAVLDDLLACDLDSGAQEYLDALTDLVEVYEAEHSGIPDAPPADVLRELMSANRLTQAKLAGLVGIAQPTISDILSGKRKPTAKHAVLLGEHFGVNPSVFLSA
jgi:HTH-type transcriptional regulator/antitoxin HigA